MADTSGHWFSNVLDAGSFSCILISLEEYGRSLARAGPTMPWYAQWGFLCAGVVLSFLGKKGPKMWSSLWGWFRRESSKAEIAHLKTELAAAKEESLSGASKLKIESATWNSADRSVARSVVSQIDSKSRTAVAFLVNPDNLGGIDPKHGDNDKRLEVSYTFEGLGAGKVERRQGEWITLPEDPMVERLRGDLAKATERQKQTQAEVDQLINERGVRRVIETQVWELKQAAISLKRRGGPHAFLARPFDRLAWIDEEKHDPQWREDAIRWHETLLASDFCKGAEQGVLMSLDFEDLLAEIDEYGRQKSGLTASFRPPNPESPMVGVGPFELKDTFYGCWLYNYGANSAVDVKVLPFWAGRFRFSVEEDVRLIPGGNGSEFVPLIAWEINDVKWRDMSIDSALHAYSDSSGIIRPSPLALFVEYKNKDGHQFRSRHDVRFENSKLKVLMRRIEAY